MARILIAEDDRDLCWIWSETLADAGHEVVAAYDGRTAADVLATEPFDVLISDVVMPGDGAIVLSAIARELRPAMRIVVVTGSLALRDRPIEEAVDGADRTMRKPIDLDDLVAVVEGRATSPGDAAAASRPSGPRTGPRKNHATSTIFWF